MKFLLRLLFVALVSFTLSNLNFGIHVDRFSTAVWFSLVLALLNIFVKPLLILFTLPATILTFGLFLFVVNAIVVLIASRVVTGFTIDDFWSALLFSIILSLATAIFNRLLEKKPAKES